MEELPPSTVTSFNATFTLDDALSVSVVPGLMEVLLPSSTVAEAVRLELYPIGSMIILEAVADDGIGWSPINVHTELAEHAVPLECSNSMITCPLSPLAAVIALGRVQGVERGQLVVLLLVLLGDAYSITDAGSSGVADAIDGSTKLPNMPIRLPSSTSPAVLIENILKYPPNLRIDPAGKRKVIIKALLFFRCLQ